MIDRITIAQLAELAQETEHSDPIDWSELSINEEQAYILMASHMLEKFGNTMNGSFEHKYLTLLAICVKLNVENFVLNLKILGKK
tara:strand:+ start:1038 stop:1292 length:255 start_codon:yes stop_codon:yes gene_type:complete